MLLGVNIDHVATLRQARLSQEPEPARVALAAEAAGADSIVVHLREDRRHIQDADLRLLRTTVRTRLNLEMSIAPEIVRIAEKVKPDQATFVPEKRRELTTEGGLDVVASAVRVKAAVERLIRRGIMVSLFIDPDKRQIDASYKAGARMIELHTGRYADARTSAGRRHALSRLREATEYARSRGIIVNAGHGLDYNNVAPVAGIAGIEELNIGYSIVCRAVMVGMGQAVREMKMLINP